MDTAAFIRDINTNSQLTLLTDRARGCSAQGVGQLETMLHRRLLYDDNQGVGEALNESTIVRSISYASFSPAGNETCFWQRSETVLLNHPLQLFFTPMTMSLNDWLAAYESHYEALTSPLPPDVHLITFYAFNLTTVLIRVGNILAVDEGSSTQQIDLNSLAPIGSKWTSIRETTLTANANVGLLADRLKWNMKTYDEKERDHFTAGEELRTSAVTLAPLQIRTFVATLSMK